MQISKPNQYTPSADEIEAMLNESLIDLDFRLTKMRKKPLALIHTCASLATELRKRGSVDARLALVNRHYSEARLTEREVSDA